MAVEKYILWGMEAKDVISIGALSVAFLALFIAPLVNAKNSKRQVIAPMRQAWINALRDKVAEIVSIVSINRLHITPMESDSEERKLEMHKEDQQRYERLMLLTSSVELHINATESDHQNLVKQLISIVKGYHDNKDINKQLKSMITLTQKILSDEWKVTKKT